MNFIKSNHSTKHLHQWPKFWFSNNVLTIILLPLSWLLILLSITRKKLVTNKLYTDLLPVVVVGNLVLGGSGKTPMLGWLIKNLQASGVRVAVVSRGYRSTAMRTKPLLEVQATHTAEEVGDEPCMLKQLFPNTPIVIATKRLLAVQHLSKSKRADLILSDDGLQHYQMPRQFEIVMADAKIMFANQQVFPAGPLREPMSRLASVDWIIKTVNQTDSNQQTQVNIANKPTGIMKLIPIHWRNIKTAITKPLDYFNKHSDPIVAIAGIGNPQRFFDTCTAIGINATYYPFKDHHAFCATDFAVWQDTTILMTGKDAVKCKHFSTEHFWYLEIETELDSVNTTNLLTNIIKLVLK